MSHKYILALDQGTSSSRALLFNREGEIVHSIQEEFTQIFPQPGWVEHDALEIWKSQLNVAQSLLKNHGIDPSEISAIGITNQRETCLIWDKKTGIPLMNAIVWQDRRTSSYCDELKAKDLSEKFHYKTGLVIDSYFSGTKLKWMLDQNPDFRDRAKEGEILFGTIDTWLIWNLTGGKVFATDPSNASRTLFYNIRSNEWDAELLEIFDIPLEMLPEVLESSGEFGMTLDELFGAPIRIASAAGDQQAALFGQLCFEKGTAKNTYGTGCFMLMNTGETPFMSKNGLLTTVAWKINGKVTYALEGSVYIAGAAIQWLRDGLEIIEDAAESQQLALSVEDSGGVVVVPAFSGLGAPYWDTYARGGILGITRGTNRAHITRATLESIAFQVRDVLDAMESDTGIELNSLQVDGGAIMNDFLMQFQADILQTEVSRPKMKEVTAFGAAALAGLHRGFWNLEELKKLKHLDREFIPELGSEKTRDLYLNWKKAVKRVLGWATNEN